MIHQACINLRPNAGISIDVDGIHWHGIDNPPTQAEILAEADRLQAEYDAKEYQRQRASEYPSIVDQLDTLYHGGYDAWREVIQAVKDKYPKGQA
jgi:hypothetical protein